jgi:dihydropteroate synthase
MFTLNCNGRLLVIDEPIVMGIINTTPDSFYSGSRYPSVDNALEIAAQMISEGATILDIGGQSTRPGSTSLAPDEEIKRVIPLIKALNRQFPAAFISIDTYQAEVAKAAVDAGAGMVNDIGGGFFDPSMLSTVASLRVPYICMHVKGNPTTMHSETHYENVTREVLDYFIQRIAECQKSGIHDLIVDPGFGFSKTIEHNFRLLKDLSVFHILQKPILLGISRKSTIYKTLGITANEALNGSTVLHTSGLLNGANILRVHDVKEAVEAVKLTKYLK